MLAVAVCAGGCCRRACVSRLFAAAVHCLGARWGRRGRRIFSDGVRLRAWVRRSARDVFARSVRSILQLARTVSAEPTRRNFCSLLARCIRRIDCRASPFASPFVIAKDERAVWVRRYCCHFFHLIVVFFLTLSTHESIHSSTATNVAELDANHRKGRIGKWQQRKQPRKHPRRRPRRKPRRRSNGSSNQKGNTSGDATASPEVFVRISEKVHEYRR